MTLAIFPPPSPELWQRTLDKFLRDYTGRGLADLPPLPLETWYASGRWPAQRVAEVLTPVIDMGVIGFDGAARTGPRTRVRFATRPKAQL